MTVWALRNFRDKYPDPVLALSLRIEDVAWFILKAVADAERVREWPRQGSIETIMDEIIQGYPDIANPSASHTARETKVNLEKMVCEGCQWLENEGLIARLGDNAWVFITRKGWKYASEIEVKTYLLTRYLSVDILHPKIRKIYADFADGDFDSAISKAFRQVELYARLLGALGCSVRGPDVFVKLFQKEKFPSLPEGYEEKNLDHLRMLFMSSRSLLRNPSEHEETEIPPEEAISIIMIANHCLQILDKFSAVSQQEQKAA